RSTDYSSSLQVTPLLDLLQPSEHRQRRKHAKPCRIRAILVPIIPASSRRNDIQFGFAAFGAFARRTALDDLVQDRRLTRRQSFALKSNPVDASGQRLLVSNVLTGLLADIVGHSTLGLFSIAHDALPEQER